MNKYRVLMSREQFYHVTVEAHDATEAFINAMNHIENYIPEWDEIESDNWTCDPNEEDRVEEK